MTVWSTKPVPGFVQQRYGHEVALTLNALLSTKRIQWRFTGKTHFAVKDVNGTHTLVLTAGSTASDPVYKAKYRTALRHWGIL